MPLRSVVEAAASAHDLGKLDAGNQDTYAKGRQATPACDHVDAGVAHLMAQGDAAAAWLVRAHHAPGLPDRKEHFAGTGAPKLRGGRYREGKSQKGTDAEASADLLRRTDGNLARMIASHKRWVSPIPAVERDRLPPLDMRLALSCLVDADHEDTARADGHEPMPAPEPRWAERIAALDTYVNDLSPSGNAERDLNRRDFYHACKVASPDGPIIACDGPVGIGKTTAVAAYLLRRARDEELRRLIVVAPWTSVITQTVRVLRRALVLDAEDPEAVVAEHHHRADFSERGLRDLAATWRAPIVVTTAVQFFGTLSARHPGQLRKLHALPGSAVFLDEAHAALPAHLWRQNWAWMRDLADRWSCRFVLASGSLARFWEKDGVVDDPAPIPDLVGNPLRDCLLASERRRVRYVSAETRRDTIASLCDRVAGADGPRLVILNTVEAAGRVAHEMRERKHETYHLSTALAPGDREPIIDAIHERLAATAVGASSADWTLVATSCVEAGVDFSFRTAFRERWSASSLIQIGGRANRNALWSEGIVHDVLMEDGSVPSHPGADPAATVLGNLLGRHRFADPGFDPAALVTEALVEEVRQTTGGIFPCRCWRKGEYCSYKDLTCAEESSAFPCVAAVGDPIPDETLMVIVGATLRERFHRRERPTFRDLVLGTVRLWPYKIHALSLPELRPDLYDWTMSYDPTFLGYMQGVIERGKLKTEGGFIL